MKLPVIAIALVVGTTATALAQSTVTTTTTTVERVRPAKLSPSQRTVIYRTVTKERHVTPAPRAAVGERVVVEQPAPPSIVVGQRIPSTLALEAVPESVYVEEPALPRYKYYYVNNQVVLVDPASSEVVDILDR